MSGLIVENLQVDLGSAQIVRDVSLVVEPGDIVGLAGRNGAGKTTTLRAISGVRRLAGGTSLKRCARKLSLGGVDLPDRPDRVARLGIAHVPEGRGILGSLTVRENLRFGCVATGHALGSAQLRDILDRFAPLQPLLDRPAAWLSGGEQQMLAIARGLLQEPNILIVDELSLGLSPRATYEVAIALMAAARDRHVGVLIVDQNVRLLSSICDAVYLLHNGSTAKLDQTSEAADEAMREVYFT